MTTTTTTTPTTTTTNNNNNNNNSNDNGSRPQRAKRSKRSRKRAKTDHFQPAPGKKEHTPPLWHPPPPGPPPDPNATEQKKPRRIPCPWEIREKSTHHKLGREVHTIEAAELEKEEKEGFHGGGVYFRGNPNGRLSKWGLGPKGANWAKKGPFGVQRNWSRSAPKRPPMGSEKVPICPEKARFPGKDFPPIFSEYLGLKPPFVSPHEYFFLPRSSSLLWLGFLDFLDAQGLEFRISLVSTLGSRGQLTPLVGKGFSQTEEEHASTPPQQKCLQAEKSISGIIWIPVNRYITGKMLAGICWIL